MIAALILLAISGLCWTFVYVECVRVGLKQKTYSMPFWALTLNIAWEAIYFYVYVRDVGIDPQTISNGVCDIGILYTYFRYGKKYFSEMFSGAFFFVWSVLGLTASFVIQFLFVSEFGAEKAIVYSAFLQNLLMSILFIAMYVERNGMEGQNLKIAVAKFFGTLAATTFGYHFGKSDPNNPTYFILVIGLMIAIFDLIYIAFLIRDKNVAPLTESF